MLLLCFSLLLAVGCSPAPSCGVNNTVDLEENVKTIEIDFSSSQYNEARVEFREMADSKDWNFTVNVKQEQYWKEFSLHIANQDELDKGTEYRYHEATKKVYIGQIAIDSEISDLEFEQHNRAPNCDWVCGEANCSPGDCCYGYWHQSVTMGFGYCIAICRNIEQLPTQDLNQDDIKNLVIGDSPTTWTSENNPLWILDSTEQAFMFDFEETIYIQLDFTLARLLEINLSDKQESLRGERIKNSTFNKGFKCEHPGVLCCEECEEGDVNFWCYDHCGNAHMYPCFQEHSVEENIGQESSQSNSDMNFSNTKYDEAKAEVKRMLDSQNWSYEVNVKENQLWKEYTGYLISNVDELIEGETEARYHETLKKWYISVIDIDSKTTDISFAEHTRGPSCDWVCDIANCPPGSCCHAYWVQHMWWQGCSYTCINIQE